MFHSCKVALPGVYSIVTSDGKRYIGSSHNLKWREATHFYKLKAGKHCNKSLQKSYNTRTRFEVLEECPESELLKREHYYIDTMDNLHNKCRIVRWSESDLLEFAGVIKLKISISQDGCWRYCGQVEKKTDYGVFTKRGRCLYTHRVMFFNANPNEDMIQIVRHLCKTKNCCNPDHLTIGSYRDNSLDIHGENRERFIRRFVETDYDREILMEEFNICKKTLESRVTREGLLKQYPYLSHHNGGYLRKIHEEAGRAG
tara:strand:- start:2448 stop:3218 length:771 start_codon:yes stop_codon:yes gene_type:complete